MAERIAFVASEDEEAKVALVELAGKYGNCAPEEADVIVPVGGDGFMLQTLHTFIDLGTPIYGMNRGSVGFLMNEYHLDDLHQRLEKSHSNILHPLKMKATDEQEREHTALAINEVSLLRQTGQAAHIQVSINDIVRIESLVCDGILLATAAGSTAYNYSAYGPILPLGSGVLALTPISPFRPRRWRGAILPHDARVSFEIESVGKRPVSATADATEIRHVKHVEVSEDRSIAFRLLFDPQHNLEERILNEQFAH